MAIIIVPFSASLRTPLASSPPPFLRIAKLAGSTCESSSSVLQQQHHSPAATAARARATRSAESATKRRPHLVALEYADLNLPHNLSEESDHVRVRQHTNPLTSPFSMPAQAPNWDVVLADPTLPSMVMDIGSGEATLVLKSLCHPVTSVCIHCNYMLDSSLRFRVSTFPEFPAASRSNVCELQSG